MPKRPRSRRAKKESHVLVKELPDGQREVTVDGHTWIEGPYSAEQWREQTREGNPIGETLVTEESPEETDA